LDKKIIVTGGTYGIGARLVAALVAEGAAVAFMARSAELGEPAAAELSAKGPGVARFYRCDVSDRAQVKAAFAAAVKDMGGLDGLVNVAGVERGAASPELETDENWDYMFDVNAKGTFISNQEAFPYLKANGGGRILNFGSGAGILGLPPASAYSASKAAITGWTRSAAMAWGKHGVTVNIVNPTVWTPMYGEYRARLDADGLKAHDEDMARRVHVGGKLGDMDQDLIPVLLFMLSDGSRFMTGQLINVDGGLVMSR
jgi:NAD(P)-dependent dehydrogenase (short-subunit alcohol dehydrogenase family)